MRMRGVSARRRFVIAAALFWAVTLLAGGCDQFNHCTPGSSCTGFGSPGECLYIDYYDDEGVVSSRFVKTNDEFGDFFVPFCNSIIDKSRASDSDCS